MTNSIQSIYQAGQQIYYDGLSRTDIQNHKIQKLIEEGVRGLTSNPVIFQKSFQGNAYDAQIKELLENNPKISNTEIFEACAVLDIQMICDAFLPLYQKSEFTEGYVSLEVSPLIAGKKDLTLAEARKLWKAVNRPNLFIKIPSTDIHCLYELTLEGIKINTTLLFSVEDTLLSAKEKAKALLERKKQGLAINEMQSVESHFVSRIDSVINPLIDQSGKHNAYRQKVAIYNSYLAYAELQKQFASDEFRSIEKNLPRLLLASTGCKEKDRYPEDVYVQPLLLPHTLNTLPVATYEVLVKQKQNYQSADFNLEEVRNALNKIDADFDLKQITDDLKTNGVELFQTAFNEILKVIDQKKKAIAPQLSIPHIG